MILIAQLVLGTIAGVSGVIGYGLGLFLRNGRIIGSPLKGRDKVDDAA